MSRGGDEETMQRHIFGFALVTVTLALSVSCSSDSNDNTSNPVGSGATGGTGSEDSGSLPGVPCGNERCMPPQGSTDAACCLDRFTSQCGVMLMGRCSQPPAPEDPRCPSTTVPFVGMLSSCCTPSGDCGIIAPAGFGSGGCTELAEAQRQADQYTGGDGGFRFDGGFDAGFTFDAGGGIRLPPPQRCDR
jgi:hypothetical protein